MFETLRHLIKSPVKENREIADQKPFIIRGHHLPHFYFLNKDNLPDTLAVILMGAPYDYWLRARQNLNHREAKKQKKYAQDILGLNMEYAQEYYDRIKRVFETFLTLPDDHPAEIVEGVPDIMCNTCLIGKHCKRLHDGLRGEVEPVNALESDRRYAEKFINALDNLNLPKPTITYGHAYFSDADPQEVRRVKTTIGTIRQVLRQKSFDSWS